MSENTPTLVYPTSGQDFEKFRNRILMSLPPADVDAQWISSNLNIPSSSNAAATLRTFRATGFIDDTGLTSRGQALRGTKGSDDYRAAMLEAIRSWIGADIVDSILAGNLSKEALPGLFRQTFRIGDSAVRKAFAGLRWLASEAGNVDLTEAFGGASSTRTRQLSTTNTGTNTSISGKRTRKQEESKATNRGSIQQGEQPDQTVVKSTILSSGVISFSIDHNWDVDNIRKLLVMLQKLEQGESLERTNE